MLVGVWLNGIKGGPTAGPRASEVNDPLGAGWIGVGLTEVKAYDTVGGLPLCVASTCSIPAFNSGNAAASAVKISLSEPGAA